MNEKELKQIYTKNIKKLREKNNITQSILAEKIGITDKYLSAIETGSKWGSFETLVSIANALQVEPYELLLPESKMITSNTKRTKELMKRLRINMNDIIDTLEDFLSEEKWNIFGFGVLGVGNLGFFGER